MNRKKFIKDLKAKLSILEESEISDIIQEYSDIVDDKMANGITEEEAISDFGDIDELSKEILKAYKVNPKFAEKEETDLGQDFESFVKKGARKLTEVTKDVAEKLKKDGNNITIEFVFEIIIKVIILLIILVVLRLPFIFITFLGESVLKVAFFPIDSVLIFIWNVIVWVLYLIACVLVGMAMFKKNIKFNEQSSKKKVKETKLTEEIKEETQEQVGLKTKKSENTLVSVLMIIIKIFVFLTLLFPIWFIICGICLALIVLIYHLIIGINCWGLLLIAFGGLFFFTFTYRVISNILNGKRNYCIGTLFVSIMFIGIGSLLTFNTIRKFDYVMFADTPNSKEYTYTIENVTNIYTDGKYEIIMDDQLQTNEVNIIIYYYDDYNDIVDSVDSNGISIRPNVNIKDQWLRLYDRIVEDLKNNKMVNYNEINDVNYKIFVNTETVNKIRIID